jgi:hypothetical protein
MIVKEIRDEDFTSYKKPAMVIGFPRCNWKCERECGMRVCQNGALAQAPNINMSATDIVKRYMNNPITSAVVCGGLEPLDSWDDLQCFITEFRYWCDDPIIILTGYEKIEIIAKIFEWLYNYPNIIIKYGRFIPNQQPHYDDVLGVKLASDNQRAERIS